MCGILYRYLDTLSPSLIIIIIIIIIIILTNMIKNNNISIKVINIIIRTLAYQEDNENQQNHHAITIS